jgi:hypothetical protein
MRCAKCDQTLLKACCGANPCSGWVSPAPQCRAFPPPILAEFYGDNLPLISSLGHRVHIGCRWFGVDCESHTAFVVPGGVSGWFFERFLR